MSWWWRWLLLATGTAALAVAEWPGSQTAQDLQASSTRVTRVAQATRVTRYGSDSIVVTREDIATTRYLIRPKAGRALPDSITCTTTRSSRVTVPQWTRVQGDSVLFGRADQDSSRALCRVRSAPPPVPPPPPPVLPPPPPPNSPPLARATVTCVGYTCRWDGSSSTDDGGITRAEWRAMNGFLRSDSLVYTETYPTGTTTVRGRLWVYDVAGLMDTVTLTTPALPAAGGGVDPMLLGVRPVSPTGGPLGSTASGDSILVCTQAYVLGAPTVVTVPSADMTWCAGAAVGGTRPITASEQSTVDAIGFCGVPQVSDPMVRVRPVGRCAAWLVVP